MTADTRDYSYKELVDDVPEEAYINVPAYKHLTSVEDEFGNTIDSSSGAFRTTGKGLALIAARPLQGSAFDAKSLMDTIIYGENKHFFV